MGLVDANARNAEKLLLTDVLFLLNLQKYHNYDITITCDTNNFAFQLNASLLHWALIKTKRVQCVFALGIAIINTFYLNIHYDLSTIMHAAAQ